MDGVLCLVPERGEVMDFTGIGFYGAVCGALAGLAPYLGAVWVRIIAGAVVGVASSFVLPAVRDAMGALY